MSILILALPLFVIIDDYLIISFDGVWTRALGDLPAPEPVRANLSLGAGGDSRS